MLICPRHPDSGGAGWGTPYGSRTWGAGALAEGRGPGAGQGAQSSPWSLGSPGGGPGGGASDAVLCGAPTAPWLRSGDRSPWSRGAGDTPGARSMWQPQPAGPERGTHRAAEGPGPAPSRLRLASHRRLLPCALSPPLAAGGCPPPRLGKSQGQRRPQARPAHSGSTHACTRARPGALHPPPGRAVSSG